MKKMLVGIFVVFAFFEATTAIAIYRPRGLGWVTLSVSSGTVTEITNSTAPTVGYMRWCYNCAAAGAAGTLCISTGTANFNQFVLSTGTVCK